MFDSGIGGLTVVAALRRHLPHEAILYLGDTARLPYGSKSEETVTSYTRQNVEFLTSRGAKAVVIACNTASALALPNLRTDGIPLWGVVGPGSRRAAEVSRGRVGVLATESTVRSDAYGKELRRLRPEIEVESRACPLFVALVEEGWHDDPVTEEVARRYLAPLLDRGVDSLVLGCTHYPMLRPLLGRVAGPEVSLVDSADTAAAEVARGLDELGLLRETPAPPEESHLYVTDASEGFGRFARRILGEETELEWVEVG